MTFAVSIGEADSELDRRLSDDAVNSSRTPGVPAARELTVRIAGPSGELMAGILRLDLGLRRRHRHDLGPRVVVGGWRL